MMRTVISITLPLAFAGVLAIGCDRDERPEYTEDLREKAREAAEPPVVQPGQPVSPGMEERAEEQTRAEATAELKAAEGKNIDGKVQFQETPQGVRVVADIRNAPPGKHGFHIHEKGDCSDIDNESMGGHFAPEGYKHALPGEADQRHLGDLGNVEIGQDGKGQLTITIKDANLKQNNRLSFAGKAVVVHSGEDMGKGKQPSGSSGTPIACGVIERE
ncbi:MAG: superoxide dismutase family protein [Myxococcota bacterium]